MCLGHKRAWALGVVFILILQIASFGITIKPAFASGQFLFWPNGSSLTTFGGNEGIFIDTGAIDFVRFCEKNAIDDVVTNDFLFPFADIYIVLSGSVSLGSALTDVSGTPNTVQGTTGGLFVEEFLGITKPDGKVKPGTYAVVYDECQNGELDPIDFLLDPAFNVVIPVNVPPIDPAIQNFKTQSGMTADSLAEMRRTIEDIERDMKIFKGSG